MKDRPCAVVLLTKDTDGSDIVTVQPITHTPPSHSESALAIEIPLETKRRLGLDDDRAWIVLSEANRFAWPGPDLRMTSDGDASSVVYGMLPERFFERVRTSFLSLLKASKANLVRRTE